MNFEEKLQILRREHGLSQEQFAERLGVSRQAVAKWETGAGYPDINNLIRIGEIYRISLDSLLRSKEDSCGLSIIKAAVSEDTELIDFLCKAKKSTYAACKKQEVPSRPQSHDLVYQKGRYFYMDTYLGGEKFSGEEAVWVDNVPRWAMNYSGRVLSDPFSGDFLKEALALVPKEQPFRGPMLYQNSCYSYHCIVSGCFDWFQGYEEIFYEDKKVYECHFHGGSVVQRNDI